VGRSRRSVGFEPVERAESSFPSIQQCDKRTRTIGRWSWPGLSLSAWGRPWGVHLRVEAHRPRGRRRYGEPGHLASRVVDTHWGIAAHCASEVGPRPDWARIGDRVSTVDDVGLVRCAVARPFGRSTHAGTGGALAGPRLRGGAPWLGSPCSSPTGSRRVDQMLKKPADRAAAVRDLASSVGGSMEALCFMFGDRDGFVILDVPAAAAAAALAVAVSSSGAFSPLETRQLVAPGDLPSVLGKAARARETYRRPGTKARSPATVFDVVWPTVLADWQGRAS